MSNIYKGRKTLPTLGKGGDSQAKVPLILFAKFQLWVLFNLCIVETAECKTVKVVSDIIAFKIYQQDLMSIDFKF